MKKNQNMKKKPRLHFVKWKTPVGDVNVLHI